MKNILVINGHPNPDSFCSALASSYVEGIDRNKYQVEQICLHKLEFSPILKYGYQARTPWEPDLETAWQKVEAADHIVIIYPTWWYTMPALLKGFFDRLFIPGKAFAYRENSVWWDKLLKGKTAHLVTTMDTPAWYYALVFRNSGIKVVKQILSFCGIKTNKVTIFSPMKSASDEQRKAYLAKMRTLATNAV